MMYKLAGSYDRSYDDDMQAWANEELHPRKQVTAVKIERQWDKGAHFKFHWSMLFKFY